MLLISSLNASKLTKRKIILQEIIFKSRLDTVKESVWNWNYFKNQSGQYEIGSMTAYCPKCDVELRHDTSYKRARCPNCLKEWDTDRTYVEYGADKNGIWEDYTDTLHIITSRVNKYTKKISPSSKQNS